MNPLFQKKTNDDQDPIILPQDDNPQGDMLDPATHKVAPPPPVAPAEDEKITEPTRMASQKSAATINFDRTDENGQDAWEIRADDRPVGEVYVGFDTDEEPAQPYINSISVVEEYRHQGIGKQVVQLLADHYGSLTSDPGGNTTSEAHSMWRSVPGARQITVSPYGKEIQIWKIGGKLLEMSRTSQPASNEQKIRMRELLNRGYNHMEAAEMLGLVYTPTGKLVQKQAGRPTGTLPLGGNFKNKLLQKDGAGAPLSMDQGQTTCYKCKQPIQQGQTISWEGGMESHMSCPPPPQGNAQEQSRIMFPKGQQPKKPQTGQPAQGTPPRPAAKPMYSSAEKVATRRKISGFVPATSWGVPQEYAHQVARTLAEAGQRDFDVATDEEKHIAFFSFGNEIEMEVCADIVCEYFGPQIKASKGKWIGWQCRPERQPNVPVATTPITKLNSKEAGTRSDGIAKLKALGIKTTADLDKWIKQNPGVTMNGPYQGKRYLKSRYEALCEICGEDAATWLLHDMATDAAAKELGGKRASIDPQLATLIASWVSLMLAKWVGSKWKERFSNAEEPLVKGTERMLAKAGIYDLSTLDQYAAENKAGRYKALAKLALTNLVLAAAVTLGMSAKDLFTKATAAGVPEGQAPQTQTQQAPVQNPDIYIGGPEQQQPKSPLLTKQKQKEQERQRERQMLEQIREQDAGRNPQNVASLKTAKPKPEDYEGSTIEEQVANLMERRAFSEDGKGDGWAIYSRNTEYPDDGTWIKVFFKDGKVAKAEMFDEEPENVLDTRLGFEGLHSFTQAYGD